MIIDYVMSINVGIVIQFVTLNVQKSLTIELLEIKCIAQAAYLPRISFTITLSLIYLNMKVTAFLIMNPKSTLKAFKNYLKF